MQGMWTRFFPAVVEMRKRISDGYIGQIKCVQANFGFKRKDTSGNSRLDNPKLGGGAVLDVGVYPISLATMVFGERPSSIHATGWLTSTGYYYIMCNITAGVGQGSHIVLMLFC